MLTHGAAANLLAELDLGSSVAETDDQLEAARIETSVFDDLWADRVDLIPGTKGSGKSALYRIFVDFLSGLMLTNHRVVLAHGVQQRQDTVFLAYKQQFDALSESEFVDFWCIYFISLAYEQFIKEPAFEDSLAGCETAIADFRAAYRRAGIPDLDRQKSLKEILAWALGLVARLSPKPKATYTLPGESGQIEFSLDFEPREEQKSPEADIPRMPGYIEDLASALDDVLECSDLRLWLMVDRLDEIFARRSDTEKRALRALLRTLQIFRSDRVRVKVFLRDDIFEHIVSGEGFTALTHVTSRMADTLRWSEEQILAMIIRRIFASEPLRSHFQIDDDLLRLSTAYQREMFYRIFSDTVYRPPNQSPTLRWLYNHTKDGRGVVTPRDVIEVLVRAAQRQRDSYRLEPDAKTERLINGPAIAYGLEEVSRLKRVNYLEAEFPHLWEHIKNFVGGGTEYSDRALRKLLGRHTESIIDDLVSIGVLYRASRKGNRTYRIPFLYRRGLECTQRFIAT